MTTGVYLIVQRSSGRSYVGQSKDIDARLEQHFAVKKLDSHRARTLRGIDEAIWRSRDESDFVTKIVTVCGVDELDSYEAAWIDALGVANALVGFNAAIRHVDSMKALTSDEVDDAKDFIAAVTLNLPILNTDALVAELRSYRKKFEKLADMLAESQSRCRELEAEISSHHAREQSRKNEIDDYDYDYDYDNVFEFVDARDEPIEGHSVERIRRDYESWCVENAETPVGDVAFCHALSTQFGYERLVVKASATDHSKAFDDWRQAAELSGDAERGKEAFSKARVRVSIWVKQENVLETVLGHSIWRQSGAAASSIGSPHSC